MASGTLYVVATPIGNLEDITLRALRILREVDLIAAEDTRRTAKLLAHFEIRTPTRSLHEHNEWKESDRLVKDLEAGQNIALVTDAGTPAISDPGSILVGKCRAAGVTVTPIPGPSAIMAALSVSGEPGNQFVFAGYVPRGGTERLNWFERLGQEDRTIIFFETPHRIARTLEEAGQYWPFRQLIINREITKLNEQFVLWQNTAADAQVVDRGELVVIVRSSSSQASSTSKAEASDSAAKLFGCLTLKCGISDDKAMALASKAYGVSEPSIAKILKKLRIAQRQADRPLP